MRSRSMAAALGTFALRTNQQSFFASSTPASTPLNQTDRKARDEVFLIVGAPSAPQRERADLTTRDTSHLRNNKSTRSEERRVGQECASTCRTQWSTYR